MREKAEKREERAKEDLKEIWVVFKWFINIIFKIQYELDLAQTL